MYNALTIIFAVLLGVIAVLTFANLALRDRNKEADAEKIILMDRIQELKDYIRSHGIV